MASAHAGIGHRIAPARFVIFALLCTGGVAAGVSALGWSRGVMAGFDVAAAVFVASCLPLLREETESMRAAARVNDANRALLLAITVAVTLVILFVVASELGQRSDPDPGTIGLIVGTLVLAWTFANTMFALHYAHIFYLPAADGTDRGGLDVPGTAEPDYWDFVYFAFTLGMTFQTSDVEMQDGRFRRAALTHSLAAFLFNISVLAFTVNVLGS
jgi:uncharacterized membrane protein